MKSKSNGNTIYVCIYIILYISIFLYYRSTKTQSYGVQLLEQKLTFKDQIFKILFSYFLFKGTIISHSLHVVQKKKQTKQKQRY